MSGVVNVRGALQAALNAMTPSLPTAWENVPYTPVIGTAYQAAFCLFAEPNNAEFGSRHQERGIFHVNLRYPIQAGTNAAETRAELIRTTFARGNSFTNGGVVTTIEKTPEVSAGTTDGDFWLVPVRIRFYANI